MPDHPLPTGPTPAEAAPEDTHAPAAGAPIDPPIDPPTQGDPRVDAIGAEDTAPDGVTPEAAEPAVPGTGADGAVQADPRPAAPAVPELSPAACAARLGELFPALFKGQPKPLKLRIQADIQQRAPGVFTKKSLSGFLHRHTTTTAYLIALTQSPQRVDLDGQPAGELAPEHVEAAATELARRRGMHEARRAAENAARRETEQAQRQARAAEDDARRDRALLLRAFETSTLTRANFCALKRIAEPELEALLATAREEAAQRAKEGWHDGERPNERPNLRPNLRPNDRPQDQPQDRRRDGPPGGRPGPRPAGHRAGGPRPRPAGEAGPGPGPRRGPPPPKPQR